MRARAAAALLSAALLAACASTPPSAPGESPWTSGRISVRIAASATQPAQSMSAGFELRAGMAGSQPGAQGELRLNSPIGTRLAQARWAPGEAVLITSEGEQRFDSLDSLSRQALGEALPLAALGDWLAGRPWPAASHTVREDGFEQLGWHIVLARKSEGLIEAQRAAPPAVTVRVRLDGTQP